MPANKTLANPEDTLGLAYGKLPGSALKRKYVIPPFSVLNTRDGYWQDRRREWIDFGIQSELGRDVITYNTKHLTPDKYGDNKALIGETSIFDPVLCEFVYANFCFPGGQIVDPFSGGSVRGIVASVGPLDQKGLRYWGCDLSERQVRANQDQLKLVEKEEYQPTWVVGDSLQELDKAPEADLVFSCPPYGFLEVYSDDPRDISNMTYEKFLQNYTLIIRKACAKLRESRFAVFVVASFRDRKTHAIYDLPGDTIRAFRGAGLVWYNDMILVNAAGTAPVRARTHIENGNHKVVKLHQNVLVFLKGKAPSWDWTLS